jgi:hypothetical protein
MWPGTSVDEIVRHMVEVELQRESKKSLAGRRRF